MSTTSYSAALQADKVSVLILKNLPFFVRFVEALQNDILKGGISNNDVMMHQLCCYLDVMYLCDRLYYYEKVHCHDVTNLTINF